MEQFERYFDIDGDGTPARCDCAECATEGRVPNARPADCIYYTRRG